MCQLITVLVPSLFSKIVTHEYLFEKVVESIQFLFICMDIYDYLFRLTHQVVILSFYRLHSNAFKLFLVFVMIMFKFLAWIVHLTPVKFNFWKFWIHIKNYKSEIVLGKIAAAYDDQVIIFEPTPLISNSEKNSSKSGSINYWWVETARIKAECKVTTLAWNNDATR